MIVNVNGKDINVNEKEVNKLVEVLGISEEEAVQTWLEDNDYEVNEEVAELTKKAKENKITATIHGAQKVRAKKEVVRKEDPDKEWLIQQFADTLGKLGISYEVTNIGKIIEFEYNDNSYKIDLVKRRPAK